MPRTRAIDVVAQCGKELRRLLPKRSQRSCSLPPAAWNPVRLRQVDLSGLSVERPSLSTGGRNLICSPTGFAHLTNEQRDGSRSRSERSRIADPARGGQRLVRLRRSVGSSAAITKARLWIKFEPPPGRSGTVHCRSSSPCHMAATCATGPTTSGSSGEVPRQWELLRDV
jgi:hypothetical protein